MINMEYALLTESGGREENEDSVCVIPVPNGLGAVVADGLGGYGGGKLASKTAVRHMIERFESGLCKNAEEIEVAVHLAHLAVLNNQTEQCEMKTTLAALFIENGEAIWAHVGDSRVYHFYNGRLAARTLDHSVPQLAVLMGLATEEDIRGHEDRSRIVRALGSDSFLPDISKPLKLDMEFHAFLLCSDGFWEYVLEQEMEGCLKRSSDPGQWLDAMKEILRQRAPSDQDNYSAAAIFTMGERI